jgi:hypothetical protein
LISTGPECGPMMLSLKDNNKISGSVQSAILIEKLSNKQLPKEISSQCI